MTVTAPPPVSDILHEVQSALDTDLGIGQLYLRDSKTATGLTTRHTFESGGTSPGDPNATLSLECTMEPADNTGYFNKVLINLTGIALLGSAKVAFQHSLLEGLKNAGWKISRQTVLTDEFMFNVPGLGPRGSQPAT